MHIEDRLARLEEMQKELARDSERRLTALENTVRISSNNYTAQETPSYSRDGAIWTSFEKDLVWGGAKSLATDLSKKTGRTYRAILYQIARELKGLGIFV